MNQLWAAWRMKYITNAAQETGCIFCNALAKADDDQNLVIRRAGRAFIIINKYPYTSGHLMVAPFAHQASLELLQPEERAELMELVSECIAALRKIYNPHGFNVGINIGAAAGAGVPGHVHIHIVPRWNGDTNFMSTVGGARVLPESLEETYRRVKEILNPSKSSK